MQFNNCKFLVFHTPENYEATMNAFHQAQSPIHSKNNDKKPDIVRRLPMPFPPEVGSYLLPTDTASTSLVSKKWNTLTKSELNSENAKKLGCNPEEVSTKITEWKKIVSENMGCLDQRILTATELDVMGFSLFGGVGLSESQKNEMTDKYFANVNAKMKISEKIRNLFYALFNLRKVGLASWEELERVATVLKEKSGSNEQWQQIAFEKVQAGEIQSAKEIAVEKLHLKYESPRVFYRIVQYYVNKNELQEAYGIYSTFLKNMEDSLEREDAAALINMKANENEDYLMLEQMIDGEDTDKVMSIQHFIESLIEKGKYEIATEKVQKYRKDLDYLDKDYLFSSSIQIYVKLGFYEWAKNLAESALAKSLPDEMSDYTLALHHLRNTYEESGLNGEAEKVQKRIDEMKAKK